MYGESLKNQIQHYIREQGGWVPGSKIEDLARTLGYKSSNAGRRCRELVNAGVLDREIRNRQVHYCIAGTMKGDRPQAPVVPNFSRSVAEKLFN